MNSKIVSAFLGGAAFASGIVYVAVKEPVTPVRHVAAAQKPVEVAPAAEAVSPTVTYTAPPVADLPRDLPADQPVKRMQREKRSPMSSAPTITTAELRAPAPRPTQAQQSPAAAPEPVREPLNKDGPYNDAKIASANQPPPYTPAPSAPEPVGETAHQPEPRMSADVQPHTVTITAGTVLPVRIGETLTANKNQPGDSFLATLDQPLVVDGFVIAERGARLEGRIVESDTGGRVRGTSHMDIELVKLATADGQHIRIRTSPYEKQSQASTGADAAKVGVGAAIGAAIGGMAGGGKGAGIGAGVGGAAGAGDVLLTRGKPATIPVETRISFRLRDPVTITEQLR